MHVGSLFGNDSREESWFQGGCSGGVWGSETEGEKPIQEDVLELATPQAICAQSAGTSGELFDKRERLIHEWRVKCAVLFHALCAEAASSPWKAHSLPSFPIVLP